MSTPFTRSPESVAPLYEQVMQWLEQRIENDFGHDERFFTERELVARLGVSQPTVRRALQELVDRRLLHRHVGRGTFVQKHKRTRLLGVIMPHSHSPVLMQQLNCFAELCDEFDCNLRVHHTRPGSSPADPAGRLRDVARALPANPHEERMVFLGHSQEAAWTLFDELDHRGFRTVSALPFAGGYPGDCVSIDVGHGVTLALDHLRALGHRRIAILVNEPVALANVKMRLGYLRDYVAAHGMQEETVFVDCSPPMGGNSFEPVLAALPALLGGDPQARPTAIVPISGIGAWAALRHAGRAGLSVPRDFSVLAFDDLPGSDLLFPALTAIHTDGHAYARRILEILWSDEPGAGGDRASSPRQETFAPSLVLRESTAPLHA
ncbi:transcriptional regulator [Opitutaceae bacterium TAV1]|nr:transcriptional regulator [Opitutaceae bacterium TAV1]